MNKIMLEKLRQDILHALRYLYHEDKLLIKSEANVHCIAARFFAYMMNSTYGDEAYKREEKLDWDLAYNRTWVEGESKVVSDLVLHHRGNDDQNILAVELKIGKKNKSLNLKKGWQKLSYLTSLAYRYQYGLSIVLGQEEINLIWFKDGNEIPYSYETYSTKTWESLSLFASPYQAERRRRTCTLMVTRACNLNCTYCYEPYKCADHKTDMTFETAKEILRKEFEFVRSSDEYDEIEIDFMGGEPLMNFPLIKQIVEWLEQEPPSVSYICFATTNGTLVNRYESWLRAHTKTFQLGASYDGTPEMQRVNRGTGEYFENNLELIHDIYPKQGFHMTISKETLPTLAEGVLFVQRKGWRLEAALAQGVDWNEQDARLYRSELEKLARAYLGKDKNLMPLNLLTRPLVSIAEDPEKVKQEKFCGTGTHMATYDYDGKKYGCHLFTPIVLGERAIELKDIDFSCEDVQADPECANCRLKSICPTCAGFNYRYRGSLGKHDHRWCKMVAEQMRVACAFQIKKLSRQKYFTAEELGYARVAAKAWPFLENLEIFKVEDEGKKEGPEK